MNYINDYFKKVFSVFLVSGLVLVPITVSVSAQIGDVSSQATSSTVKWYVNNWRDSGDLQQKIKMLASTAVQNVYIPVLYGVEPSNLSPNFGDPRSNGRTHAGEDIMATKGVPIVSPTAAVVLRTGVGAGEGNYVYTANPGGETFVYMHLDKIGEGVVSGTVLEQGALIGYVGNTGNAIGGAAHLHFEIHDSNGTPIDPYPRLKSSFTTDQKSAFLAKIMTQTSDANALSVLVYSITKILSPIVTANPIPSTNTYPNSNIVGSIMRNLYKGIKGEDVRTLQKFLNTHGFLVVSSGDGSIGYETTYFGLATLNAIIRYQIANNIFPALGFVGPITRAKLVSAGI